MQIRKLVYKCAMRLPKLATLCPLRKEKILGRAQFRHSATYKTIQFSKLGQLLKWTLVSKQLISALFGRI